MNIFVLAQWPEVAAKMLCDKHVNSQLRESAQMLCSAFPEGTAPMKRSHYNHPCTKWARASRQNYTWLLEHAEAIAEEYALWTLKDHQCARYLDWVVQHMHELDFPEEGLTEFAQAMPERFKVPGDPVEAYRSYYIGEKWPFARWTRRHPPRWFMQAMKEKFADDDTDA